MAGPAGDSDDPAAARAARLPQAIALHRAGAAADAEALYRAILAESPGEFDALHLLGVLLYATGRHAEAVALIGRALDVNPGHAAAHSNLGLALAKLKRPAEAVASFDRAIALRPERAPVHFNRGNALRELGDLPAALASYDRALALDPNDANVLCNRGIVLRELSRPDAALASCEQALTLAPDDADAHYHRGRALQDLDRDDEALGAFDRALALRPGAADALYARGNLLLARGQPREALASYDRLLADAPDHPSALNNRGLALLALGRHDDALASYDRALALAPERAEVLVNRGNVLSALRRYDEAAASHERALALRPDYLDALYSRGNALREARRDEEAIRSYERLLALAPDYPFAEGQLLHAKMAVCDWSGHMELTTAIARNIAAGRKSAEPFGYLAVGDTAAGLRRCAEIYAAARYPRAPVQVWTGERYANPRIRIGYVAGEFRHQATSILMAELFELHDRSRFELYAFDNGWDDGSATRRRIVAAFDETVTIAGLPDRDAAAAIRDRRIDILVNLNGYFGRERQGVFALRPAPVAVNYLGFPGTIGVDYIDYIVADPIVIPPADRVHYVEEVVYLPDTYQVNDRQRPIAAATPDRAEFGLPPDGFVFCCFNNSYKITPAVFAVWMRLLRQVPASVLWLLADNPAAVGNLRREASAAAVDPPRLVFASRLPLPEHLARHRLADLFLDTLPCNAHTTASDALWAGLPLLTVAGATFPGRVAASLLAAVGLPELAAESLAAYETQALELARNPGALGALRARLERNRAGAPLFDTVRYVRHLEAAFGEMHARSERGVPPAAFAVPSAP